ncbi:PHD finger protein [Tanacetum coccineum]
MFGSVASQPLSVPLSQMEPVSNQDASLLNNQIGMTGPMSTTIPTAHGVVANQQKASLLPTKRKVAAEPLVPNKRVVQMEAQVNSPRLPQSVLNKKHTQLHSMPNALGSAGLSNKKMMRNESMSSKMVSPRVQTPKTKSVAPEVSPKFQRESFEAVRMKMRETLASALSVGNSNVSNEGNENVSNEGKSGSQDAGSSADEVNVASGSTVANTADIQNIDQTVKVEDQTVKIEDQTGKTEGQNPQYNYVMPDTDGSFDDTFFVKDELLQGNGLTWAWDMEVTEPKEAQPDGKPNLEDKNVSGNGIQEVINSPKELAVKIEAELFKLFGGVNKKYKEKGRSLMFNLKDPSNPELREKVLSAKISPERLCSMTPEELASKELSEWRMAKAEELDKMIVLPDSDVDMRRLVKKTHKGEYQVEVVQDDDDGVSVEVSSGSSSFNRVREKTKTDNLSPSADEDKEKVVTVSTDGTDLLQELIVDEFKDEGFLPPIVSLDEFMESLDSEPPFENLPVDGTEIKALADEDNSVTVGEGEEKANSGTSSVNHVEAEISASNEPKLKTMEVVSSVKTSLPIVEPFSAPKGECLWEGDLQLTLASAVPVMGLFRRVGRILYFLGLGCGLWVVPLLIYYPLASPFNNHDWIWTLIGEKTSTKEWPDSIEIKGRVRLDAFEKFLQELPMSRSRAVMVVHFHLKNTSSEYHQASVSEAVNSYVAEDRVGFGEPIPGVEVYFCPPDKRMTEMLSRLLFKDQSEILKPGDNGLTGVVVWRRPHSTMLANSSNHHKHHRKHSSSRRQENINSNTNSNMTSKSLRFGNNQPPQSDNGGGDDDDIPPGFGPGVAARDEDDLPEFSFSKGSNSSGQTLPLQTGPGSGMAPPKPAAHMRQLVYEYGQTGNNTSGSGINNRSWNQDDDDIPEWQPQLHNNNVQQLPGVHVINQVRPEMGYVVNPVMPFGPPVNLMQNSWGQVPAPNGHPPNSALPGQYYGGQWRQGDPRGRGF